MSTPHADSSNDITECKLCQINIYFVAVMDIYWYTTPKKLSYCSLKLNHLYFRLVLLSQTLFTVADVTDYSALPAVVEQVKGVVGDEGLNLLINNAGILLREQIGETQAEILRLVYETNALGPAMVTLVSEHFRSY